MGTTFRLPRAAPSTRSASSGEWARRFAVRRANEPIRQALDESFLTSQALVFPSLAVLFLFLAFIHPVYPRPVSPGIVAWELAIAGTMFAFSLMLRKGFIGVERVHVVGGFAAAIMLSDIVLNMLVDRNPLETLSFVLLLFGMAFVFTSWRWFFSMWLVTVVAWLGSALALPPSPVWRDLGVDFTMAAGLALLLFTVRMHVSRDLIELRTQHQVDNTIIGRSVNALDASERRFRLLAENAQDVVYRISAGPPRRIEYVSPSIERLAGYMPAEIYADPDGGKMLVHPDDESRVDDALASGTPQRLDVRWIRKDGSAVPVELNFAPVLDASGTVVAYEGIGRDVSVRVAADRRLQCERDRLDRTSRDLERVNEELERFTYTVSHDLRAHLRGMDILAEALDEDHADSLADDGRVLVSRIRREVGRMEALVEDLLEFARIPLAPVERVDVDLSALATSVVERLRTTSPGRVVEVTITPDLHARADPTLTRVLLENLLGNAWKYTSTTGGAAITFAQDADGMFYVADNGIGFDMVDRPRLFQPFQRLHGTEFEGTGVGLATVARIVDRHDGRVDARGSPGGGAKFMFTLNQST